MRRWKLFKKCEMKKEMYQKIFEKTFCELAIFNIRALEYFWENGIFFKKEIFGGIYLTQHTRDFYFEA